LLGLQNNANFAKRWRKGNIQPEEVKPLADLLVAEGIQDAIQNEADSQTKLALEELNLAQPQGIAAELLYELTHQLSQRQNK